MIKKALAAAALSSFLTLTIPAQTAFKYPEARKADVASPEYDLALLATFRNEPIKEDE